jgi:hypothetical protein
MFVEMYRESDLRTLPLRDVLAQVPELAENLIYKLLQALGEASGQPWEIMTLRFTSGEIDDCTGIAQELCLSALAAEVVYEEEIVLLHMDNRGK